MNDRYKVSLFPTEEKLSYFSFFLENVNMHIKEELMTNEIRPDLIHIFLPVHYNNANTVTVRHFFRPDELERFPLKQEKDININLDEIPMDLIIDSDIYLFSDQALDISILKVAAEGNF